MSFFGNKPRQNLKMRKPKIQLYSLSFFSFPSLPLLIWQSGNLITLSFFFLFIPSNTSRTHDCDGDGDDNDDNHDDTTTTTAMETANT